MILVLILWIVLIETLVTTFIGSCGYLVGIHRDKVFFFIFKKIKHFFNNIAFFRMQFFLYEETLLIVLDKTVSKKIIITIKNAQNYNLLAR